LIAGAPSPLTIDAAARFKIIKVVTAVVFQGFIFDRVAMREELVVSRDCGEVGWEMRGGLFGIVVGIAFRVFHDHLV